MSSWSSLRGAPFRRGRDQARSSRPDTDDHVSGVKFGRWELAHRPRLPVERGPGRQGRSALSDLARARSPLLDDTSNRPDACPQPPAPHWRQTLSIRVAAGVNRAVRVGLVVSVAETLALAFAAVATGSASLATQTATSVADVAGGIFLIIGVASSGRAADQRHPLGYGSERFFWSLLAAVGIFVGGFGAAVAETVKAYTDPRPVGSFALGYCVLIVLIALDGVSLGVAVRALSRRAAQRQIALLRLLWRGTDPAVTTVVLTSVAGVLGGVLALCGLAGRELTGASSVDATASALIGLMLFATSVVLLHTNRELLTGRGLPLEETTSMADLIAARPGVVAVPDLFAVVVGPSSLIVEGDVVFDDDLAVPALEAAVSAAAGALRARWPNVTYVYLNPVARKRSRGPSARMVPDPSPAAERGEGPAQFSPGSDTTAR
jgi:cation diffusion facilitator family transporter